MHITNKFFSITVLLAGIVLCYLFYIKFWKPSTRVEGFQQTDRFILKTNSDVYDDFYGEIYDQLMLPKQRVEYESDKLIQTMMPPKETSILLDVGSGTGEFVNYLTDLGYRAYGVDKSDAMIDAAKSKYDDIEIKKADVIDPMCYDMSLFTHIFCLDYTVYEIENKSRFFYNCHGWLQSGGYFIVHLVDKDRFQPIVPAAASTAATTTTAAAATTTAAAAATQRVLNTEIIFPDFTYKSEYLAATATATEADADVVKCTMCHRETFVDKTTQNVRQNEKTLYMEPIEDTLQKILSAGFTAKGFFTLEDGPTRDKHQKIYIFERI